MVTAENQTHQLKSGTVLNGKYRIEKVLGEGGFGITYRAVDVTLDLEVAIKEYYPAGCVTREIASGNTVTAFTGEKQEIYSAGKEKFINEARTLGKLTGQKGIVSVRDYFQENNTAYIVMEFLDGITLKEYLKQAGGRISPQEALALMEPVVKSLAEVHKHGLIHRDISPDNIMIMVGNRVKLMDFGAARDVSLNGEKSLSVMLKPGYAPEEQYRTRGEQGPWSDIYALCATVYRCITGQIPVEAMERVRKDELPAPSALGISMDRAKEEVLMKGLAVFAEDRIRSAQELYTAWYGAQEPATGSSTTGTVAAEARTAYQTETPQKTAAISNAADAAKQQTGKKKRLVPILLSGVAVLAVLIGAVVFFVMRGGGKTAETPGDLHYSSQIAAVDGKKLYLRQRDGVLWGDTDRKTGIKDYEELLTDLQMGSILTPGDSYVYMVFPQAGLVRFDMSKTNGVEYVTEDAVEDGFLIADKKIYYVKSADECLYRAKTNGSKEEKLTDCRVAVNAFTLYNDVLWYYAEDGEDGKGIYVRNLSDSEEELVKGSEKLNKVICLRSGNGVIYAVTEKGEIYTIQPGSRKISDCYGKCDADSMPIIPVETDSFSGFLYVEDEETIAAFDLKNKEEWHIYVYAADPLQKIITLSGLEERVYFVTEDGAYHFFDVPEDGNLAYKTVKKTVVDMDGSINYYNQGSMDVTGNLPGTDVEEDITLPSQKTSAVTGEKVYSTDIADYAYDLLFLMTDKAIVYGERLEDGSIDSPASIYSWDDETYIDCFAMDGEYLYLASDQGLYRGSVVSGGELQQISSDTVGEVVGFIIKGEKIYYLGYDLETSSCNIYVANLDGSGEKCLVTDCRNSYSLSFDLSGDLLFYPKKLADGTYAIGSFDLDAGENLDDIGFDLINALSGEDISGDSTVYSVRIIGKELYFLCNAGIYCIDFANSTAYGLDEINDYSIGVWGNLDIADGGVLMTNKEELDGESCYVSYFYDPVQKTSSFIWMSETSHDLGYADGWFYWFDWETGAYYCCDRSIVNYAYLGSISYYDTYN